jgi:hypothetical protein
LVAFRDEMRYLPGLFENLRNQFDGVIALNDQSTDGSAEFVARQPEVLELLEVPVGAQAELEDGKNHRALTEAAWGHGAEWLFGIDADERVEREFRDRAEREIAAAEVAGHDALWVPFRELWDTPDQYRSDGIWGTKRKACLFRSDPGHRFDGRRVHAHWASLPEPPGSWPVADLALYHLRMMHPSDRLARYRRYRRIDPDHQWQTTGYEYLLEEAGIELTPVPPQRGYQPRGR